MLDMEVVPQSAARRSSRPPAKELRLSSSFRAVLEAADTSGLNTPTSALLGRASDIISRSIESGSSRRSPRDSLYEASEAPAVGATKLRSCLSGVRRHSDNPVPSIVDANMQSIEHKGLHWKPELVTASTAGERSQAHELQDRYIKLEADLKDSEAAKAMLQKKLHRVQEAMVQSRDDLENAQRLAITAEEKAAAAANRAAAAETQADALTVQVQAMTSDASQLHHP